ncbi:MAG: hypothetical protein AAGM38_15295 [Pseudomonadota bacterium]
MSGCAKAELPELVFLRPEVPERLLACPDRPAPPTGAASQREAALYLIDLAAAHGLCRDRLHAVGRLLRGEAAAGDAAAAQAQAP